MKTYYLYFYIMTTDGAQACGRDTMTDFDATRRAAMRAARRGYHCNVIGAGKLLYSL